MKKGKRTRGRLMEKERLRRGIYILPNLFTTLNIFCGFFAIILSLGGNFSAAAYSIIIAGIFDGLDGKIARATRTTSKFGIEYDSMADLISFGMAPALMFYLWILTPLGRMGWLGAFLFTVCGALRLARFNTQSGTVSSDYFVGLPIPASAGMLATIVLFCQRAGLEQMISPIVFLVAVYGLSFLMVSNIRYHSFKKPELFRKMNFNGLVGIILIFIFIAAQPAIALFFIGAVYVSSGPVLFLIRRKASATCTEDTAESDEEHPRPV
jgi:CDP-diacylglycerol---serine O-phosphatidyltransferase